MLIGHDGHDEVIGTMGEAPEAIVLVETPEDVDRLEIADPTQAGLPDADDALGRRRQSDHRPAASERFPQIANPPKEDICYATQNRQEAVQAAVARGRRGAGAGQPEQLEQPAAGRAGARERRAGLSDRRLGRHRPGLVPRRRDGAGHGRRQRAGIGGRGLRRVPPQALRRHGRIAHGARGGSLLPAAARITLARGQRRCLPSRRLKPFRDACGPRLSGPSNR